MKIINISMLAMSIPLIWQVAYAGSACHEKKIDAAMMVKAVHAASSLKHTLDRSKAKVALIARSGTNLSKYGMRFSHVGFAIKNFNGHNGWTVVHLLNRCGSTQSAVYKQGLLNFFLDDMYRYNYQVTIPKAALQSRLHKALKSNATRRLHGTRYSMLAYPFSTRYQNSNQWVLEMIAHAMAPTKVTTRYQAQMYLWRSGYTPSIIAVDGLERFGASFNVSIKFNDHPIQESRKERYSVVSVQSIGRYLKKRHQLQSTRAYWIN